MRKVFIVLGAIIFALGCARVSVQGSKEPIKLDISMRLDIYQHVQKDIDSIEGIVGGAKEEKKPGEQGALSFFIGNAYAQEGLGPEVEQAALRRKDRLAKLRGFEEKGIIGENASGLLELKASGDAEAKEVISAENSDRMIIYKSLADKNGTSVEEIQKLYAKKLQSNAPAGTPIEVLNESSGFTEWKVK